VLLRNNNNYQDIRSDIVFYNHFKMEVDEIDTGLLEQFGSLQTVDHADLIRQMRKLVGGEESISETCAQFYLEMSNWNVHAAVGHYFDLNGGGAGDGNMLPPLPSMTFVRDVTIGEGESVPPLTDFTKTWTVMNTGNEPWPEGCTLRFTQGNRMSDGRSALSDRLEVGCLPPGEKFDISVSMRSPEKPGMYESQWRMATPAGAFFGDTIWVILSVEPSGTLALTQQMDKFHDLGTRNNIQSQNQTFNTNSSNHMMSRGTESGMQNGSDPVVNPFGSPGMFAGGSHDPNYVLHSSTSSSMMSPGSLSHSPGASASYQHQNTALNSSPSFSNPHLLMRRPSSPTDSDQPVVSARNILARKISEAPMDRNASSVMCNNESSTFTNNSDQNVMNINSSEHPSNGIMYQNNHYNRQ